VKEFSYEKTPIFSKDGKYPHCSSENVRKGILSVGVGASSSGKLPEANVQVWHCDNCGKTFNMLKK